MKKRLILSLALLFGASAFLAGQPLPSLLVGADAASQGRAGAILGANPDAYSARDNAAALVFSPKTVMGAVSYGNWQPQAGADRILSISAGWNPGGRFALGLSALSLGMPEYEVINPNGTVSQVNGTYTPKEAVIALSGAFRLTDGLSVGLTTRLCRSSLAQDARATVFGADVSAGFIREAFRAGVAVQHLGGKVSYREGSSAAQPLLVRAGAGYCIADCFTVLGEAQWFPSYGMAGVAALEYAWKEMILVRGGVHLGNGQGVTATYGSLGLGARFGGFSADAAWVCAGATLRNTLLLTLGYAF